MKNFLFILILKLPLPKPFSSFNVCSTPLPLGSADILIQGKTNNSLLNVSIEAHQCKLHMIGCYYNTKLLSYTKFKGSVDIQSTVVLSKLL